MALDAFGTALLTETRQLLKDGLPDEKLARLTERGAALSTRDAITLLRDAAESHHLA